MSRFRTLRSGRLSYREGLALQEALIQERLQGEEDILILLEHDPVVTLGRGAKEQNLLCPPSELARRGIDCVRVGRGGDATFHGPGQLVGYPIVHLDPFGRDLHRYLRLLEQVLIDALAGFGITATRLAGKTGVWVAGAKVASIGVGVRRWVAWHGFALNVAADLSGFASIVPCGLQGVKMTSLSDLLGEAPAWNEVQDHVVRAFAHNFALEYSGDYDRKAASQAGLA